MRQTEEKVRTLMRKLKANREKVPLDVLKTRYAEPYGDLKQQIIEAIKALAIDVKPEFQKLAIPEECWIEIGTIFQRVYTEKPYQSLIGAAAFRKIDADEVVTLANEVRSAFEPELEKYISHLRERRS